jgi:hypothetical protein
MTFERGHLGYFIAFIIIGAILGAVIGVLLVGIFPGLSPLIKNLTGPIGFNLEVISFKINLSLSAIIGVIAGIIVFIKV